MTNIDVSEVLEFVMDIEGVRDRIGPKIVSAFHVTSRNIKDDWNDALSDVTSRRMRNVSRTVDYDITTGGRETSFVAAGYVSSIESEIGPNLDKSQGSFAGWFEEGSANVPTTNAGAKALKKHEADLENGIIIAAVDAIEEATR